MSPKTDDADRHDEMREHRNYIRSREIKAVRIVLIWFFIIVCIVVSIVTLLSIFGRL
jgi:hypothetical protein